MKIYGIITDAAEEKPLAKSKIVLYIGEIELVTFYSDKDGKFQVEQKLDQHIGEALICHAEKDNFKPREVTYKIGDEDIRLDIELIPIEREKPVEPPKEEIVPPPPPPPPPPPNMKWIKIAIAVGALIVAGIVVYFLIPGKRVIEKPKIISFDANPSQIMKGKSSTLSWQTSKAEEVEISDIGKISLSGSRKVSPRETTTYTLMARNEEGKVAEKSVTVMVRLIPHLVPTFQGMWINQDRDTRGITKLQIKQDGTRLAVHAWGKCHPQDCDWGVEKGVVKGTTATVEWDQDFVFRKMALTLQGNKLKVVTDSKYKDDRPDRRSEEIFVKGPVRAVPIMRVEPSH